MKILMITNLYPVDEADFDTPRTLYNFVQSWLCQGHQVDVIRPNFVLGSMLRKKKIYKTGWYGNVYNVNYTTPFLFDVKSKLKNFDFSAYDKVFAHMPSGEIFASKLDIDFVAGVHEHDFEVLSNPIYNFYYKPELLKAYKKASNIACKTHSLKNRFIKEFPLYSQKTFVALSGIDTNKNSSIEIKQKPRYMDGIKSENKRILTCANLARKDDVRRLVEICDKANGVQLTVIGEGEQKQKLMRMSSDVVFLGSLSQDRLFERMRASDFFILPSNSELYAQTYFEAMSCGCIPICISSEGMEEIVKDGENGFVCEFEELSSKLEEISKRGDLKEIAQNAVETAKRFTNETCAKSYLDDVKVNS